VAIPINQKEGEKGKMPRLGNKYYPYTKKGYEAYRKAKFKRDILTPSSKRKKVKKYKYKLNSAFNKYLLRYLGKA